MLGIFFTMTQLECQVTAMKCLVIDIGSSRLKIGFSNEEEPRFNIPCLLASAETSRASDSGLQADPIFPVVRGKIVNMQALMDLIGNVFRQLVRPSTDPSLSSASGFVLDIPVFIASHPTWSQSDKLSLLTSMFSSFNPPSIAMMSGAALGLFATGKTTGLVVDLGNGVTTVTPLFEGFALPYATFSAPFGGQDVAEVMKKEVEKATGSRLDSVSVDRLKEEVTSRSADKVGFFQLEDKRVVTIPMEVRWDKSVRSLVSCVLSLIQNSLTSVDDQVREAVSQNICLIGGNSCIDGLAHELRAHYPELIADTHRDIATWIGGSMLASLDASEKFHVFRNEAKDVVKFL